MVPAQAQVGGEHQFPGMVHRPPHQTDHQHLQPATLQQVDLVQETQLHKTWEKEEAVCPIPPLSLLWKSTPPFIKRNSQKQANNSNPATAANSSPLSNI